MVVLDQIRAGGERRIERILAQLDRQHRALLIAAIEKYGSVDAIPEPVWRDIEHDLVGAEVTIGDKKTTLAAAIILLMTAGDEWTSQSIGEQGVKPRLVADGDYDLAGIIKAQEIAAQTTATVRERLTRKVQDAALTGPGETGELTAGGIRAAVDDVYTTSRRATIATDATTTALSRGQRGAAERIGGDGASLADGQSVELEMRWKTEQDNLVCPRCAPLENQPEEVWGLVFPSGPGPEAHPNCRCSLRPVVVVSGGAE